MADARLILATKTGLRLLEDPSIVRPPVASVELRSAGGAMLATDADTARDDPRSWRVATSRPPTDRERADLDLAWRVARHVKSTWSAAAIEALVARIETTFRMNVDDRMAKRVPCPFLVEGSCSIYAVRPFACRRQVSIDASLCEKALDGDDANFPFIKSVGQHGANVRVATAAAAKACGIDYTAYELTSAMRKFLQGAIDIRRFDRRKDFGNEVLADEMSRELHKQVDIFVEFVK